MQGAARNRSRTPSIAHARSILRMIDPRAPIAFESSRAKPATKGVRVCACVRR